MKMKGTFTAGELLTNLPETQQAMDSLPSLDWNNYNECNLEEDQLI